MDENRGDGEIKENRIQPKIVVMLPQLFGDEQAGGARVHQTGDDDDQNDGDAFVHRGDHSVQNNVRYSRKCH